MIPQLTTANTFGEWQNDTQQLIVLMNQLTDGAQFNANTLLVLTKLQVANLIVSGAIINGLNTSSVAEGSNLYFTAARVRANVSNTGPVTYDATNGIFGFANSGATAGSYGDVTHLPAITVDRYGRITSVANTTVKQPVLKNNTLISTRAGLNFQPGANIVVTIFDDAANDQANIVLDGVWGGGPNPLGFTNFLINSVSVAANTNVVNFLAGPGVNITGAYKAAGAGETDLFFYSNNAYDTANAAFLEANSAALAANTVATAAKIRANVSNSAPITYDATNGIFGLASSGVTATSYGNTSYVASFTVDATGRITSASNVAVNYTGARAVLSATAPVVYDTSNGIFSLAASGVSATTYGDSTHVASFTVDATGRITAASNVSVNYNGARSVLSNTAPVNYDTTNGIFSHAASGVTAKGYGDSVDIPVIVVDAFGHLTAVTNTAIRSASTSQTGIVQLNDSVTSNSVTLAATANAVLTVNNSITAVKAGLGTMASQSSASVSITGGSITSTSVSATRVSETLNPTYSPGASAGVSVDWGNGGSTIVTNGTNAITFINIPAGVAGHIVKIDNFNNVTWPAAVDFGVGGKPSIAGAAYVTLTTINSGTAIAASILWRAV